MCEPLLFLLCYNISMNDIIVSIIGLVGITIGAIFGYLGRTKKQAILEAKREQEQNDRFDRLFEELHQVKIRLDEHNHYAEKITGIKESIISIKKDIEYIRKDIQ